MLYIISLKTGMPNRYHMAIPAHVLIPSSSSYILSKIGQEMAESKSMQAQGSNPGSMDPGLIGAHFAVTPRLNEWE